MAALLKTIFLVLLYKESVAFFQESSPLHIAVERGNIQQLVDLLAEEDADVNALDALYQTPLHAAACCAKNMYMEAATLIIKHGGDVDIEDEEGKTALHWAAMTGKSDLCNLLVSHNASIDAEDSKGWTALHFAAAEGHHATVAWLCEHGSFVNSRTRTGATPLIFAVDGDHVAAVKVLVQAGADPSVVDASGNSCKAIAKKGPASYAMLQALDGVDDEKQRK